MSFQHVLNIKNNTVFSSFNAMSSKSDVCFRVGLSTVQALHAVDTVSDRSGHPRWGVSRGDWRLGDVVTFIPRRTFKLKIPLHKEYRWLLI